MLLLLSPAKSLDFETPTPSAVPMSTPQFVDTAAELIETLREVTPAQLASLMALSDKLATLNVARYAAWTAQHSPDNSKPAVLAFNGDVYDGLAARTLSAEDLAWAQQHVVILSGLYGLLRPLDALQPYRLEMGTRWATARGKDLYAWWGDRLALALQQRLAQDPVPVVVNLASQEYAKSVLRPALRARVIECVFEDGRPEVAAGSDPRCEGRGYRIVSFHAKRARGLMARFAVTQRVQQPQDLQAFDEAGYRYVAAVSGPDRWVFRRPHQPPLSTAQGTNAKTHNTPISTTTEPHDERPADRHP